MRGRLPIAALAIVIGALETAGGAQELIFQGFLRSRTYPLIGGTLGNCGGSPALVGWNRDASKLDSSRRCCAGLRLRIGAGLYPDRYYQTARWSWGYRGRNRLSVVFAGLLSKDRPRGLISGGAASIGAPGVFLQLIQQFGLDSYA